MLLFDRAAGRRRGAGQPWDRHLHNWRGYSSLDRSLRFDQVLPGTYLFEATTPLHDAIEASGERTVVSVLADTVVDAKVVLQPLADAVADVCRDQKVRSRENVLAGHVTLGTNDSPMPRVRVTVEWPGGDAEAPSRDDGYYRTCAVPRGKLLLVRASPDHYMVTQTLTLENEELVRQVDLKLQP